MADLTVIIVLYNEFDQIEKCINSVVKEKIPNIELLVVDNNSEIIGFEKLKKKYPQIHFIRNKNNLGFARAANVGFMQAAGKFLLLLTPDTTVLPGTIKQTVSSLEKNSQVGLIGCRVYSYPRHFHQSAFHNFPNLISHLFEYNIIFYKLCKFISNDYHPLFYSIKDHKKILYPQNIIGAYLLLRKKAGEEVGYFDSDYYMYREETDLCKRLKDHGWEILYLPVGGLIHFGGAKWRKSSITQCSSYYMKSTYTFFRKHHSSLYTRVAWVIGLFSSVISIPYLMIVVMIKNIFHKSSQSRDLLPCWIEIFKWHIAEGRKIVF